MSAFSNVLLISSNLTGEAGATRRVALSLIDSRIDRMKCQRVVERNLYADPLPRVADNLFGAGRTERSLTASQRKARVFSETLIAEVETADTIVIAAPMPNLALSSPLKSWIDLIARAGRTFEYTPQGPVGLLHGKRVVIVGSRAPYRAGDGLGSSADFHEPYLRAVLGALGLDDITFLYVGQKAPITEIAGGSNGASPAGRATPTAIAA